MKRIVFLLCLLLLTGCGLQKEEKIRDLEFTVVQPSEEPEALQTIINEKKQEAFELTFCTGNDLYLVVGYGPQYIGSSIQVKEVYETKTQINLDTTLIGPETVVDETKMSYPYIVVKIENIMDKQVNMY